MCTKMVLGIVALITAGACARLENSQPPALPADYVQQEEARRAERDQEFRSSPFSRLALIERTRLTGKLVTIGRSPRATLRLEAVSVEPIHAQVEGREPVIQVRALKGNSLETFSQPPERATTLTLNDRGAFRIDRFNIRYVLHEDFGPLLETYDSELEALREFAALDYFPVDSAYRVMGEVVPDSKPRAITLLDSQGAQRPYWVYGELQFTLSGKDCRLELYTPTLEEVGQRDFMLIFQDKTSGNESYPAARYLYVEGKRQGEIVVDFNRAFSPPCNYSRVFSCPFPRPGNRLPVEIRAGEKWYRGAGL